MDKGSRPATASSITANFYSEAYPHPPLYDDVIPPIYDDVIPPLYDDVISDGANADKSDTVKLEPSGKTTLIEVRPIYYEY